MRLQSTAPSKSVKLNSRLETDLNRPMSFSENAWKTILKNLKI